MQVAMQLYRCPRPGCQGCLDEEVWWNVETGERGTDQRCLNCGWRQPLSYTEVYTPLRPVPKKWKHESGV